VTVTFKVIEIIDNVCVKARGENFKPSARLTTEHACYNYAKLKANTPLAWRPGVLEQNDDLSGADKEEAIVRGKYAKCQARHVHPLLRQFSFCSFWWRFNKEYKNEQQKSKTRDPSQSTP
jgi:hypothetical protein